MNTSLSGAALDIDLQKYWLVLKRRWLPSVCIFGAITALATQVAIHREPTYQASGKVLVRLDRTPSLAGLDVPGATSIGEPNAIGLESDPIATEVETILSLSVAEKTIATLNLKDSEGNSLAPKDFFAALDVNPIPGTDIIRISYEDSDPELAAAVVNQVIQAYRDNNIASNQIEAIAAREFITQQLPTTEAAVRRAEADLRQFKEQNQVVALVEESTGTVEAIQQLDLEIAESKAQLATIATRSNDLQRRLGLSSQAALQAAALSQSTAIQDAFGEIRQVQSQLDLARARYRNTHPTVITLAQQEAILQQRLQQRVAQAVGAGASVAERGMQMGELEQALIANLLESEVERASLISRINELNQAQVAQRNRASIFPRLEATQRELERRLTAAQSTYEALLQRSQEIQIAQNQVIDNIRVVSEALVPEDATSSKKMVVLAGMAVGLIMALITAFILDLCDRSVKTVGEARQLLDLPILGVLPLASSRAPVLGLADGSNSDLTQAYRMLQANLSFVSSHTGCKVIVVTSAIAQEGRSRVAANLALAMSQAGSTVLLVDADLRQPTQHQIWNCANDRGLVQVLERTVEAETVMQPIAPNVFLMPLGKQSPNSLATFSPKQLHLFIQQAAQTFDIVLFDTPPLTQTADASTLGTLADGTLMVIRPGLVQAADVRAAKGLLTLAGQPVLGMVVNGVERTTNPSQYFAYASDHATATINRQLPVPTRLAILSDSDTQTAKIPAPVVQSLP